MNALPIAQLESIRFKLVQTIDSIRALQVAIHADNQPYMVPWPELLSKYNVILSQTHSLMHSLSNAIPTSQSTRRAKNPLPNLVLHPPQPINEGQMDHALSSLLRMMRLPEVLEADKETVVKMGGEQAMTGRSPEEVIGEMQMIKEEHDKRVERATLAVRMLRDKYIWKKRVGDGSMVDEEPVVSEPNASGQDVQVEEEEEEESDDEDDDMEMVAADGKEMGLGSGSNGAGQPPPNGAAVPIANASDSEEDFEMVDASTVPEGP